MLSAVPSHCMRIETAKVPVYRHISPRRSLRRGTTCQSVEECGAHMLGQQIPVCVSAARILQYIFGSAEAVVNFADLTPSASAPSIYAEGSLLELLAVLSDQSSTVLLGFTFLRVSRRPIDTPQRIGLRRLTEIRYHVELLELSEAGCGETRLTLDSL